MIIDLVVASVLMSMGMMMLSPMLVSAPFKILLFVLVDGWVLTVGTLAASFNPASPEPDGTWGKPHKVVGGVHVASRLATADYWDGTTT